MCPAFRSGRSVNQTTFGTPWSVSVVPSIEPEAPPSAYGKIDPRNQGAGKEPYPDAQFEAVARLVAAASK